MDFELTQDQLMLQEALQRFVAGEYGFERRNEILATPQGFDPAAWRGLAEQGALGIGLPEEFGGLGGPVEVMVAMEQLGRGLVLEPYLSTVVLGAGLIADQGSSAQKAEILPRVVAGECRLAVAHSEAGARYDLRSVRTTARASEDGYALSGTKIVALDAPVATSLIVSATDEAGAQSLFLVEPDAPGVELIRYRTQDGRSAADVKLNDARVSKDNQLGAAGSGLPALRRAVDRASAALCAEAVGIIEALNQATLEYLKSRRQFGQPLGRFQVLQHRMADMFIMAVQARSMSMLATGRLESADETVRRHALSAAKAFVGKAARFVGQQAVQLHGGMGMSADLIVSHYFKRLTMINATLGDAEHHLAAVSDHILASNS